MLPTQEESYLSHMSCLSAVGGLYSVREAKSALSQHSATNRCTVSTGHLESGDAPPVHRFLGLPRRSGTAMHHFLNGLRQLAQSHFRRAWICVNHKTSGSRPSRPEASHLDFPLEIASEAFNPANFFAARPRSCTISYPETGKCIAPFLNVTVS